MLRVFLVRGVSWQGLAASGMGNKAVGMSVHLRNSILFLLYSYIPGRFLLTLLSVYGRKTVSLASRRKCRDFFVCDFCELCGAGCPNTVRTFRWPFPSCFRRSGQVVVQLFDNAMVGRLGALPLAAVSFGGAVFVIFLFWGTGLSMGLTPLVGEMYARRDYRSSARLLQNALTLYGGVGIVLSRSCGCGRFSRLDGQSPKWQNWHALITAIWRGRSFRLCSLPHLSSFSRESATRLPGMVVVLDGQRGKHLV